MVLVLGRRRIDLSKPSGFCGRHKIALSFLVVFIVLLMSASVCAMQAGPSILKAKTGGSAVAAGGTARMSGGDWDDGPMPPAYRPIVYHEQYDFESFSDGDWFMAFLGTDLIDEIMATLPADDQPIVRDSILAWMNGFVVGHEGYVRWPRYHKLWSRSEIGQPI
jgi:hypothetical protein